MQNFLNRRQFITSATAAGLIAGFDLPSHGQQKKGKKIEPTAKAVINIFLAGGLAAQESFDPKIYSSIEYRGPFRSIKTKIPGIHFSEHFKRTAKT